jgi:hypothetical protein
VIPQKRRVHVLLMDNYFPELCALTLPTIEAWAKRSNAEVNYITKRRWPEWPLLTEKLQVWYDGADCDWNVMIDADVLVHPETPDLFAQHLPADHVIAKDAYNAHRQFNINNDIYFLRDGRDLGLSSCVVMTSRWCHDLWRPLPEEMDLETACANIIQERKCIDEYSISRNMARFGFKLSPPVDPQTAYNLFYHLGVFGEDKYKVLKAAQEWRAQHWHE